MGIPLAAQLRPQSLATFVGQQHLVGEGKPLKTAIEKQHAFSFLLWGPPGVGKTTLAHIYAQAIDADLFFLSAVSAGKKDVKQVVEKHSTKQKILFLDEIHRFSKSQQDYLLPFVEKGDLLLIGATTENPSFEVIPALLSRCRVFTLKEHTPEDIATIVSRAYPDIAEDAIAWLGKYANGDARQALGIVENALGLYEKVTVETLTNSLQNAYLRYDKQGEEHYNVISAFIKSMRASKADAAMYYLARMLDGGEDPKFIARRMVIFASEDIGMAQPTALVVANEVFRAVETIGLPECAINLAHGVTYLSRCQKDRSSYNALRQAQQDVKTFGNLPVPMAIRNAPTKLMKDMGYGAGDAGDYFPDTLSGKRYFTH